MASSILYAAIVSPHAKEDIAVMSDRISDRSNLDNIPKGQNIRIVPVGYMHENQIGSEDTVTVKS
jgi:hypothetical protein